MLCDAWIRHWRLEAESRPASQDAGEEEIRMRALAKVERRRHMRFHLGAFLLGLVILGGLWVAINYTNSGGWPDRLSDKGRPGDWNPTTLVILSVWALLLAIHGLRAYLHRPVSELEIERAAERLRRG